MTNFKTTTFNSPLEAGLRAVEILVAAYPKKFDLQQLVAFDHLIIHTGDVGGPKSLHPMLPLRTAELLVRRKLIEEGLLLMMGRDLIERFADKNGILYQASDQAESFVSLLSSPYLQGLKERAIWVIENFGNYNEIELKDTLQSFFDHWVEEFQNVQQSLGAQL